MGAAVIAELVRDPTRGTPKVLHLEYGGMDGHIRGRQRERLHHTWRIKRIGPMHQVGLRVSARERHHTTRLQVRHHVVWHGGEGIDQAQTARLSAPAPQRHIQRLAGVIDVRPPYGVVLSKRGCAGVVTSSTYRECSTVVTNRYGHRMVRAHSAPSGATKLPCNRNCPGA